MTPVSGGHSVAPRSLVPWRMSKRSWTGGGDWQPYDPPEPPKPPPEDEVQAPPVPAPMQWPAVFESALVAGRFDPPHAGHQHLIATAGDPRLAKRTTIALCTRATDRLPWTLRADWLRRTFPDAQIVQVALGVVEDWHAAAQTVARSLRTPPGVVFSSEADSGAALARAFSVPHRLVDPDRAAVPISSSALFNDPMTHFAHVLPAARADVVRRVACFGGGGVGKSTLVARLGAHYQTRSVPEYARTWNEHVDRVSEEDVGMLIRMQQATEDAAAAQANRLLFCDTGATQLLAWARSAAERRHAGKTFSDPPLSASHDLRFVLRKGSETPRQRQIATAVEASFERRGWAFVRLDADVDAGQVFDAARVHVEALLERPLFLSARGRSRPPGDQSRQTTQSGHTADAAVPPAAHTVGGAAGTAVVRRNEVPEDA